jgi:hypothetical protein
MRWRRDPWRATKAGRPRVSLEHLHGQTMRSRYKLATLFARVVEEEKANPNYRAPLLLDIAHASSLVSALQLALRHPSFTGPSAKFVRSIIDRTIARVEDDGLFAIAEMMRLGDNPEFDECKSP